MLKFFRAELMREVSIFAGSSGPLGCFPQLGGILVNPSAVSQCEGMDGAAAEEREWEAMSVL